MKPMAWIMVLGVALLSGVAHGAGDPAAGREKAFTCLGCHGVPGYRNSYPSFKVPKLAGQHAAYLVSALKAYRDGQRDHQTMQAQARQLSDQDMQDIAAYFAQSAASQ